MLVAFFGVCVLVSALVQMVYIDSWYPLSTLIVASLGLTFAVFRDHAFQRSVVSFHRRYSSALFQTFCVLIVVLVTSYISRELNVSKDISKGGMNSLSPKSVELIEAIDAPLQWTLYAPRSQWESYIAMFTLFRGHSRFLDLEMIDTDRYPEKATAAGVQDVGTLVMNYKGRMLGKVISQELDVAQMLYRLLNSHNHLVCLFKDEQWSSASASGLSELKKLLESEFYKIREVERLDSTCELILAIGPLRDLSPLDIEQAGVRLLLALDPALQKRLLPNWHKFLESIGIELISGMVLDATASTQGRTPTVLKVKDQNVGDLLFPSSMGIRAVGVEVLAQSGKFPESWLETSWDELRSGRVQYSDGVDKRGPILLAVQKVVRARSLKTTVVATSEAFRNRYMNHTPNRKWITAQVSKALGRKELSGLGRPELKEQSRLFVNQQQLQMIFFALITLVPLVLLGLGGMMFWRRLR